MPLPSDASPRSFLALAGLLLLLLATTVQPTFAAVFTVTKTADTSDFVCNADCSLREAVYAANAAASPNTITFANGANGTITLTSPLPPLGFPNANATLTITGNGAANTIITPSIGNVFNVGSSDSLGGNIQAANVTISGVAITNGHAGQGGGIRLDRHSQLTVRNCTFSGNVANDRGGAIYNDGTTLVNDYVGGTLTVINSTFSGNSVTDAFGQGGGIFNAANGTLTVINSTFSGNSAQYGGAIGNESLSSSTVNLKNSILANSTGLAGDCNGGGTFNVQNSLIEDGTCGVTNGVSGNLTGDPALNGNLTLRTFSKAINAGSNVLIPAGVTTDLAGNARIQFTTVDMGAYESAFSVVAPSPTPTTSPTRTPTTSPTPTPTTSPIPTPNSFVVTKTADTNDGSCGVADCSLREAITAANAAAGADTITFATGANGTITLASALPVLANKGALTILGNGATNTIVSGNHAVRVFEVATGATATISRVAITNGTAGGGAGGISNQGTLTVRSSTISGNSATGFGAGGGGILNVGTLTVTNSTISGNSTESRGGGISTNAGSTLTATNCTFSGNSGGGISNLGTLNLNNSILANTIGNVDCSTAVGTVNVQNSLIEDGSCGVTSGVNGNLTGDPALNGNLTLANFSRAINAGSNALIPAGITTDLADNARIQFATVDMGAYESAFSGVGPSPTASSTPLPTTSPTPTNVPAPQAFVVTKTADTNDGSCDPADCSLREAITAANAAGSSDTISFAVSANGTITLTSALPGLTNNGTLTITGNGAPNTIVSGNHALRIFSGGVLDVAGGAIVTISGVAITNGLSTSGGGIFNRGTLTVANSTLSGNVAKNNNIGDGGGILNVGTLTVTNSTLSGNSAALGGGIRNFRGTVTVSNSAFSGNMANNGTANNDGGAIYNFDGPMTVSNSTFSGNSATNGVSGGIINNDGTLILNNSILANSTSGGDCDNSIGDGTINAQNSLIEDGSCGVTNGVNGNLTGDPALNGDLTPSNFSKAINAGTNALIPAGIVTDLAGNARVQFTTVDMGAYESAFVDAVPSATPTPTPTASGGGVPTATPTPIGDSVPTATPTAIGDSVPTATPTAAGVCIGLTCDPCLVCDPDDGCVAPTNLTCQRAFSGKATLAIVDKADPTKDTLSYKWVSSAPVPLADYGSPTTTSNYRLCIFDGAQHLQLSSVAPAGGTCTAKGKPCWAAKKSSFVYTDAKELTPDGLASATLKAGTKPKQATIKFVGKKALLQSPTLPLITPITVRVQRSDGASCYEAVFSTPKKNVIGKLTGKSD